MDANLAKVQQSFLTRNLTAQRILQEGSQVLVRITADKGNGKYEGSLAGAKILLNAKGIGGAETKLSVGSSFVATVSLKNGQVQIIPKNLPIQLAAENQFTMELANQQAIFSFLESIGLPAEELSYHLLQQFKQLSMKLDSSLLQRIRNVAIKFKGKEKSAAELLSLLAQKGINGSEDELLELLEELDGDFEKEAGGKQKKHSEKDLNNSNDEENLNRKKSFNLMNKINSTPGSWYFFPYEIIKKSENLITGTGSIRMLMDDENKIRLLNLLCNYDDKKYLFSLLYENGSLNKIKMNVSPWQEEDIQNKTKKLESLIKRLSKNKPIEVLWCDSEEIEGSACTSEDFFMVDGEV